MQGLRLLRDMIWVSHSKAGLELKSTKVGIDRLAAGLERPCPEEAPCWARELTLTTDSPTHHRVDR